MLFHLQLRPASPSLRLLSFSARLPATCSAQIDDPLDTVAVHAGGGMWGMLGCAALASSSQVQAW